MEGPIPSPTFTIGRTYQGRLPVSHLDLYRLSDLGEEEPGMLDDYIRADAVAFIEWPRAAEPLVPHLGKTRRVRLEHAGGDRRRIEIG